MSKSLNTPETILLTGSFLMVLSFLRIHPLPQGT